MGGVGDGLLSPCEGDCSPSSSSTEVSSPASLSSGLFMSVSGRLLTKLPCCLGGFRTFLTAMMIAVSRCSCMSVAKGFVFNFF